MANPHWLVALSAARGAGDLRTCSGCIRGFVALVTNVWVPWRGSAHAGRRASGVAATGGKGGPRAAWPESLQRRLLAGQGVASGRTHPDDATMACRALAGGAVRRQPPAPIGGPASPRGWPPACASRPPSRKMAPRFRLRSPLPRPFGTPGVAFLGHARSSSTPLKFRSAPSSSLLRPDVPDSAPPPDFTSWLIPAALAVAARRGGSGAVPSFASYALTPCRCPYAARVPECTCPSLPRGYPSSPMCAGLDPLIFRHSLPPLCFSTRQPLPYAAARCLVGPRGESHPQSSDPTPRSPFTVGASFRAPAPSRTHAPGGWAGTPYRPFPCTCKEADAPKALRNRKSDPYGQRGRYPRSFRQRGHPTSTSD